MNYAVLYVRYLKRDFFNGLNYLMTGSNIRGEVSFYLSDLDEGILFFNFHSLIRYLDNLGVPLVFDEIDWRLM